MSPKTTQRRLHGFSRQQVKESLYHDRQLTGDRLRGQTGRPSDTSETYNINKSLKCLSNYGCQGEQLGVILWGLLGPETLASERRTRTLGLGATVRSFNDLAVPGLGGVWFGKELLLATLGVAVAERLRDGGKRAQNIEVTNAIEALACWLAYKSMRSTKPEPRLRGSLKMSGKEDLSFATVRKRTFYVTQPMRQATVQPLRALGLVESTGERFNAFRCTKNGEAFMDAAWTAFRPHKRSVLDHLVLWAKGDHDDVKTSPELRKALSPIEPMSESAREFLRELLVQGSSNEASRRCKALDWVDSLRDKPQQRVKWDAKPAIMDALHWRDLRAGALFFAARDSAIALLDQIESNIGCAANLVMSMDAPLPEDVVAKVRTLRQHARTFLDDNYDPSRDRQATKFCLECTEGVDVRVLEMLLSREGHVLKQRGRDILPGVAFRGKQVDVIAARSSEDDGAEAETAQLIRLPEGISHRVRNLFLLNLDLCNELGNWLAGPGVNNGGA